MRRTGGWRLSANSGTASPTAPIWPYTPDGDIYRQTRNTVSALTTALFGQPGLFNPHKLNPWFLPPGAKDATSFYDNTPLKQTLEELVDFKRLNDGDPSFLGRRGQCDDRQFRLLRQPEGRNPLEHILASGALPPAFPMVQIGTDYFWDGGIVSNTPLQHLLAQDDDINSLVFQVGSVQRPGRSAPHHVGRAGPPQGHHVFLAHLARSPTISPGCSAGKRAPMRRWSKCRKISSATSSGRCATSCPTFPRPPSCS
jgi:predicted acylesterase/phospholipase RssA